MSPVVKNSSPRATSPAVSSCAEGGGAASAGAAGAGDTAAAGGEALPNPRASAAFFVRSGGASGFALGSGDAWSVPRASLAGDEGEGAASRGGDAASGELWADACGAGLIARSEAIGGSVVVGAVGLVSAMEGRVAWLFDATGAGRCSTAGVGLSSAGRKKRGMKLPKTSSTPK